MGTMKQKRVAKLIVDNATIDKPLNGGQVLEKVGYSKGIQKYPSRVIESEGVKEELAILGFSPDAAKEVVSQIMHDEDVEPNARLKAADMTFKVHGTYAPEKSVTVSVDVTVDLEDLSLAKQLLDQRRGSKTSSTKGDGVNTKPVD